MKETRIFAAIAFAIGTVVALPLHGAPAGDENVRTIRLLQDDGQAKIVSKVYELKHLKATDIRPFVEAAVKRYSVNSTVGRVNYPSANRQMIIVTTGEDFLPYVDEIIEVLDKPGKPGTTGSLIEGTGVTTYSYTPKYRAAEDIIRIINDGVKTSEGEAFLNKDTNTIYWKDDEQAALASLEWVKYLDRPLPQVNIRLNYYEIRESKLRDIGLDYLAWKSGPGLDIFSAGYNGGKAFSNEAVWTILNGAYTLADITQDYSAAWGYGGFFTAPSFDMSFLRVLQQSGDAKLAAHADLTLINTPVYDDPGMNADLPKVYTVTLTPGYENISKNDDDKSVISEGGDSTLTLNVINPVICFGSVQDEPAPDGKIPFTEAFYADNNGGVVFAYNLASKTVTEKSNRGEELGNSSIVSGELTLGFKTEKLLATYVREQDVEQTVGIPFLVDIPILKYIFGTTTTIKEKTYVIVTAEANCVHPNAQLTKAE